MNRLLSKLIQPFADTRQSESPEALLKNTRKFEGSGIFVFGSSPSGHPKGWQVRVPESDVTMLEHNGRRYAVCDKEFTTETKGVDQPYEVIESKVPHPRAKALLAEFAPGKFFQAGRYAPDMGLAYNLNSEMPKDPNGDVNGPRERYYKMVGQSFQFNQDQFEPHDVVINEVVPAPDYRHEPEFDY